MTIKWKIFGIANYIMLLVFVFLLLGMFKFSAEEVSGRESQNPLLLLMFCFFTIILNSILSLYVFHFHLPAKPIIKIKRLYRVSTILYILCLVTIFISIVKDMKYEIGEYGMDDTAYIIVGFISLILLIGIFIAYNQFLIGKYLDNNYKFSIDKKIDEEENKGS